MSSKPRYLTKSRYKLALSCPTKLFYTKKPDVYADCSLDDPFLRALARGGFQVGELAKLYYPGGHDIETLDYEKSLEETNKYLTNGDCTIYEAAVKFQNLFVRVDILRKKGNIIELIEVKSKSFTPDTFQDELWDKNKLKKKLFSLKTGWHDYIYDLAFQAYVVKKAFPDCKVVSYLMCADKTKITTVDGLNQLFMLKTEGDRTKAKVKEGVALKDLGQKILAAIDLTEVVDIIHDDKEISKKIDGLKFEEGVQFYQDQYSKDEKIKPTVGSHCKTCEFRSDANDLKSGFRECWAETAGFTDQQMDQDFVFDLWNTRSSQKQIDEGKHFLKDLSKDDINIRESDDYGLTNSERQWLQVEKVQSGDFSSYLNTEGLQYEFKSKLKYPLNFIDFETTMVAIPFNAGKRPYEQLAFQFSHHLLHENGHVEHKNDFIHTQKGEFPNFEFIRALKKALEQNSGSIFRYSHHENTVLCQIHDQLFRSCESDKDDLMAFIETITRFNGDSERSSWEGARNMIDLCEWVRKYYYSPSTKGSNSIKYVLPAIVNDSGFLKEKYGRAIYGGEIPSKNFHQPIIWLEEDSEGSIIDPYQKLPRVHSKYDKEQLDLVLDEDNLSNGGAAMIAYAMMQFTEMSDTEFDNLKSALLKYCELDTLAMVMIFEAWREAVKREAEEGVA